MAFVRVKLTSTTVTTVRWEDLPVVVDLKIDDESRRSIVKWPLFGAMGRQESSEDYPFSEYYPFRMDTNGRIDFGILSERYASMNLLEKEIRIQELVTYRDSPNAPEVVYRIEDITPL